MAGVRKALIVATDAYGDPKLTRLDAPAEDARALAEVLRDPEVGVYEVETVLNKPCQEVEVAIASFFQAGARGDTLLLHFSCHGVKDLSGELYFATTDTRLPLLKVTAVSSSMVKTAMEESRASLILCLVDCCYSGAFTKSTKAAATVDLTERLGGRGRAVITASTSLQLALDGQEEPSLFTHAVVEGLRSGEADRDMDGLVTLDEFYSYVHEKVTEKNPDQTPLKSFDVQGEVYVARRGGPISTPAPLPRDLLDTLGAGEDWQRMGAVSRLTDLLNSGHPGRALGARLELERVRDNDDSMKVRRAAADALDSAGDTELIPQIPAYDEHTPLRRPQVTTSDGSAKDTGLRREPEEAAGARSAGTQAEGLTGAGATPLVGDLTAGGQDSGRRAGRRGKVIAAALAVTGLLVAAGWALVSFTGDENGGRGSGNEGDDGVPTLSSSEMLLVTTDDTGARLVALDIDSGGSRTILDRAIQPTITHDRKWMVYLFGDPKVGLVPHLAQVDGSRDAPLLRREARPQCPYSGRPSESPDGGSMALMCEYQPGSVAGLFVVGIDGTGLKHLAQAYSVKENLTWEGGDSIVYVSAPNGEGQPTVLNRVPAAGGAPEPITDGSTGWDSHPDWSEAGLLFLRQPDGKRGDVFVLDADDRATQLTSVGNAEWPTWSPDGRRFAYLAPGSDGELGLWVQEARRGATATEIPVEGIPGPPAWGPR